MLVLSKGNDCYVSTKKILRAYEGDENPSSTTLFVWTHNKDEAVAMILPKGTAGLILNEFHALSIRVGYDIKLRRLRDSSYKKFVKKMSGEQ